MVNWFSEITFALYFEMTLDDDFKWPFVTFSTTTISFAILSDI